MLICLGRIEKLWEKKKMLVTKQMAAFPHIHVKQQTAVRDKWILLQLLNNRQSSERILAEPGSETATSCFQVRNATDWAMGLRIILLWIDGNYNHWQKSLLFHICQSHQWWLCGKVASSLKKVLYSVLVKNSWKAYIDSLVTVIWLK